MVESQSTLNSFCHQPSFQIIPHKKVSARKLYISRTVSVQSQKLFLHPKSRWELNASSVAFWLLKLSSSCSRMPFVRLMIRENFSTRLLGVEEFQLKKLWKKGFCSSQNIFFRRYLVPRNSPSGSCEVAGHRVQWYCFFFWIRFLKIYCYFCSTE